MSSTTATNTITLSWSIPSGRVANFVVIWERDTSEECSDEDGRNSTVTDGSTSYSIGNLEEGSSLVQTLRTVIAQKNVVPLLWVCLWEEFS